MTTLAPWASALHLRCPRELSGDEGVHTALDMRRPAKLSAVLAVVRALPRCECGAVMQRWDGTPADGAP